MPTFAMHPAGTYSLSNFREDLARMCKRAGVKVGS